MGDIIRFPTLTTPFNDEELQLFEHYKQKMKAAETFAEMNFFYYQAKKLAEEVNKRKNKENERV
ncbi:hypothetical protein LKM00_26500 [Bacillus wiedmannii]|uniref:hypothetical protein n=1 Tax=Bacillus wiedmannii TaxID=1890302 RepID=UPI001E2E7A5F|nr:hypothetical protein [Bacillus wiedmannii]MCC2380951.1 hypothetical protein [Bacillus wiedmannii]MCC2425365.1 hypothetical protein [Bacillus wiedmannii]